MMRVLKEIKKDSGSITMLVLVLVLIALFMIASMVNFTQRDVEFTELDENKLRALNLAEAGISNMYMNLDKYYNEDESLPSSPYTLDIVSHEDEPQGSVAVTYDINSSGDATEYMVTAKGIDKSGVERMVRVIINVVQTSSAVYVDIYDYVYSEGSIDFTGNDRAIEGPFYTEGSVSLTGNSGFRQEWASGPIVIENDLKMNGTSFVNNSSLYVIGDIDMWGTSEIRGGQINVISSVLMDGSSIIDFGLESPMIVMNDLALKGSSRIGEFGRDLDLSVHGDITDESGNLYYTLPLGNEVFEFEDSGFDVGDLVSEYRDTVESTALVLDDSLYIRRGDYFSYSQGGNSISFQEDDGKYILNISGIIMVVGDVEFGEDIGHDDQYAINYEGKGVIYATGAIDIYSELKPEDIDSFPDTNLLCTVSEGTTHFYVVKAPSTDSDCDDPNVMILSISDDNIVVDASIAIRGTVISGSTLDADSQFITICYEVGLKEAIPEEFELPGITQWSEGSSTVTFTQEWQEIGPD